MYGVDLSNYQHSIDIASIPVDFVIIKATEGLTMKDKAFDSFVSQLNRTDKLIGCYHYARHDNRKTSAEMKEEARFFITTVKEAGLLGKAILICDWEQKPTNKYQFLNAWLEEVYSETKIIPFVYGSKEVLQNVIKFGLKVPCKFWLAQWPDSNSYNAGSNPRLNLLSPIIQSNDKLVQWSIWQYTSNGKVNGYDGRVDLDYCPSDKNQWMKWASTIDNITESIPEEMQWAIDNKLFKGYGDGTFRPYDTVTRVQLATVLKRFYEMMEGK